MDHCQTKFQPVWFYTSMLLDYSCYVVQGLNQPGGKIVSSVPMVLWKEKNSPGCEEKSLMTGFPLSFILESVNPNKQKKTNTMPLRLLVTLILI